MSHKYNRRDGEWKLLYRYNDSASPTLIRTCPKCGFTQPLSMDFLAIINFKKCPQCQAKLDIPKKIG